MASRGLCAAALGARHLNTTSASTQHCCGYKPPLQHESKARGCAEVAGGGQSVFRLRSFHSFYYQFYLGLRCLSSPQGAPPGAEQALGGTAWLCRALACGCKKCSCFPAHPPVPLGKDVVFGQAHFFLKGHSPDSEMWQWNCCFPAFSWPC